LPSTKEKKKKKGKTLRSDPKGKKIAIAYKPILNITGGGRGGGGKKNVSRIGRKGGEHNGSAWFEKEKGKGDPHSDIPLTRKKGKKEKMP